MLNNVLELVKTEFDVQGLTPLQPTDIQHFCLQLQQEWKVRMEERGIEFLLEISPNIPRIILVDKLRVERILNILIENATKFTENGFVRLVINCSVSPGNTIATLHVRLQDTGIGIPADQINNVFEPFYQAHHGTTRDYDGAGIGLTVVRTLIKQIKGTVQISSVVGSGTTVMLNVPMTLAQ
jgi:signal transduction histidine kinase